MKHQEKGRGAKNSTASVASYPVLTFFLKKVQLSCLGRMKIHDRRMDIELTKSNFSKVKELKSDFEKICDKLCDKITSIQERLKNFDSSNES